MKQKKLFYSGIFGLIIGIILSGIIPFWDPFCEWKNNGDGGIYQICDGFEPVWIYWLIFLSPGCTILSYLKIMRNKNE